MLLNFIGTCILSALERSSPLFVSCKEFFTSKSILIRKFPFYALLWWLTVRDRRLAVASSIGFVKYKAQSANTVFAQSDSTATIYFIAQVCVASIQEQHLLAAREAICR